MICTRYVPFRIYSELNFSISFFISSPYKNPKLMNWSNWQIGANFEAWQAPYIVLPECFNTLICCSDQQVTTCRHLMLLLSLILCLPWRQVSSLQCYHCDVAGNISCPGWQRCTLSLLTVSLLGFIGLLSTLWWQRGT